MQPEFTDYAKAVMANAQRMAEVFAEQGLPAVSGGTDTHLMLIDVGAIGLSGKQAEAVLDKAGITVNKNTIPGDQRPPTQASGIRIGTPAITTRGFGLEECDEVARLVGTVLLQPEDERVVADVRERVEALASRFPLPGVSASSIA